MPESQQLLGLDVGDARIGIARASTMARIAQPLSVITVDGSELTQLKQLIEAEGVTKLVVGLPRSLSGNETEQTRKTRKFIERLKTLGLPIIIQDEANTSNLAESALRHRKKGYDKADIDMVAASIILQQYLDSQHEV